MRLIYRRKARFAKEKGMTATNHQATLKIGWLLLIRVAVAIFLLAVVAFIELKGAESPIGATHRALYYLFGSACLVSILAALLDRRFKLGRRLIPIIGLVDLLLVTTLVQVTGGMTSVYSIIYPLVVIYGALLGGSGCGYLFAGTAVALYAILLIAGQAEGTYGQVIAKVITQGGSLFVIAGLTSFAVARERRLRASLDAQEDAFRNLDLLHRNIIQSIDTGIFTLDLAGKIKSFNHAAEAISGWREKEAVGRAVWELFPRFSQIQPDCRALRASAGERFEMAVHTGQGAEAMVGYSLSPLLNHGGERIGHIVIFQDITRIKEMETQIEKSRKMALIGEMSAGLAHEMRNPLAAIGGSIQLLRQGLALSDSDERLMQIILRGKEQLEVFLRDFLLLSRPARGGTEPIDIDALIEEVLETVRYGQGWNDRIEVTRPPGIGEMNMISGNRSEVRQALMNIILNAVQAMPDGGALDVQTEVVRYDGGSMLGVAVRDTGCGIDDETLRRIFEPFFTSKETGTGLGLAIVARVMDSHGGKVLVDSRPGAGTTMTLLFPSGDVNRKE